MHRWAKLQRPGACELEDIDLHDVAGDPELAPLISHEGVLKYLRQIRVPEPEPKPTIGPDGELIMPEIVIYGN